MHTYRLQGAIFNIIKYVPNLYAHRIIPIQKQLSKLKELQKEITFQWIPSHCGIPGNEKVDNIAKQATYLQPRPLQVISLSSAFASVKSHFTNLWINNWLSSDKGKILQSVQKKPNDLEMYKNLPRHVQTFLTRARTGHIVTQLYLHRFHISDNPTCLWCNNHDEDLEHILLYCPSINHKRSKLKSSVPVAEDTALQYILTTPQLWLLATGIYNEHRSKYPSFLVKNNN